ncbi:hypothetical protein ABW21_db0208785 [Orbilia brochopaga]|nr:hypothetical protein ABW21_db0208785 [Drechslerella brochopaga]
MESDRVTVPQPTDPAKDAYLTQQSGTLPGYHEAHPEAIPTQASDSQAQPVLQPQGTYYDAPIPMDRDQTYYQPVQGVSQPPPQGALYGAQKFDTNGFPLHGKLDTLPPPAAYNTPSDQKKIWGMKRKTFWIVLVISIIVIIAAVMGGVVGGVARRNKNNNTVTVRYNTSDDSTSTTPRPSNTGYVPFSIATGLRTLEVKNWRSEGFCNDPRYKSAGNPVNCAATQKISVNIYGDVEDGYTLTTLDTKGENFDIDGRQPFTNDPNAKDGGNYWIFSQRWYAGGSCNYYRTKVFYFGQQEGQFEYKK